MIKKLVDITQEEFDRFEWIEIEPGIYIKTFEKSEKPTAPIDGYVYKLVEKTLVGDKRRSWEWVRLQKYEDL